MVKRPATATTTATAATATETTTSTVAAATSNTKKKKRRPSFPDLQTRTLHLFQQQNPTRTRPTRKAHNLPAHFLDGPDSDDDNWGPNSNPSYDNQRVQKKLKNGAQFRSNNNNNKNNINSQNKSKNKNKKNNDEKESKATDNNKNGTKRIQGELQNGPTATTFTAPRTTGTRTRTRIRLPDKKSLLLVLDKLQKKDTRRVFAEPVDPEELPDYHEIIEHPMDFEAVRKKLTGDVYRFLEQLEEDVNLICSNAMQYNAPSTMFFRQAHAIQELAKKEFEILRQDDSLSEAPIKPRRGRPPGSRNTKKVIEDSPPEPVITVHESSLEATPASREEDLTESVSYKLRKGPSSFRSPRSLDYCFNYSGFSASSFKSMTFKYGKKTYGSDESRRDTYFLQSESKSTQDPYSLATFAGLDKQLTEQVGLGLDSSYSISLARFGADFGPAVWKIVSKKISSVLPPGVEFGPGWVGNPEISSTPSYYVSTDSFRIESNHPMASGFPSATYNANSPTYCTGRPVAYQDISSNIEQSSPEVGNDNRLVEPNSSMQIQHPNSSQMDGVSGSFAPGEFQEAMPRPTLSAFSSFNNPHALHSASSFDTSRNFPGMVSPKNDLITQGQGMPSWQNLYRWDHHYHAELSRVFQF